MPVEFLFCNIASVTIVLKCEDEHYRASQRMLDDLICEDIASLSLNFWILSYWFYHVLIIQQKIG